MGQMLAARGRPSPAVPCPAGGTAAGPDRRLGSTAGGSWQRGGARWTPGAKTFHDRGAAGGSGAPGEVVVTTTAWGRLPRWASCSPQGGQITPDHRSRPVVVGGPGGVVIEHPGSWGALRVVGSDGIDQQPHRPWPWRSWAYRGTGRISSWWFCMTLRDAPMSRSSGAAVTLLRAAPGK